MTSDCVFCHLIAAGAGGEVEWQAEWPEAVCFVPLNPVTAGHVLVVPREHVEDAKESSRVTADTMRCAAIFAKNIPEDCNIITSCGAAATQTIRHLHIHVVPRREGDGLTLPWTGQGGEG